MMTSISNEVTWYKNMLTPVDACTGMCFFVGSVGKIPVKQCAQLQ
jgi:hypothetical protein